MRLSSYRHLSYNTWLHILYLFVNIYFQNLLKLQYFILRTFFFTAMVDIAKLRIKFSGGLTWMIIDRLIKQLMQCLGVCSFY